MDRTLRRTGAGEDALGVEFSHRFGVEGVLWHIAQAGRLSFRGGSRGQGESGRHQERCC